MTSLPPDPAPTDAGPPLRDSKARASVRVGDPDSQTAAMRQAGSGGAAGDSPDPAPVPRSRMRGNWRSLVLSMLAVAGVVLVLYAIVPRPDAVTQPAVDVTPVARQLQQEAHTTVWIPQLGEPGRPWKATSVRHDATPVPTWYAGYHRTDDPTVFVAVQQVPASAPTDFRATWTEKATSAGRADGSSSLDGASWSRFSTGGDPERRSLVGELGGMTTVVSGLADYATLETVAKSLRPYDG